MERGEGLVLLTRCRDGRIKIDANDNVGNAYGMARLFMASLTYSYKRMTAARIKEIFSEQMLSCEITHLS